MPANVLIRFGDEISKQLCNAAAAKARAMAADLLAGRERVRRDGVLAAALRGTYTWAEKLMLPFTALDFKASRACILCMKCAENCPKRNISLKNGKIRFGAHCAGCYRCVYSCPQRAIRARLFNFAILKDGYDIQRIIRDDTIASDFIGRDTKGLFKTLFKYLNE
jgi:Pyruvate/2-oxoacid:ferredoxin oxidoreductase delta subunit